MTFKITQDTINAALKKVITTQVNEPQSPILEQQKEVAEVELKEKFISLRDDLRPSPVIKGPQTAKKIIPSDLSNKILSKGDFNLLVQESENRPEDFEPLKVTRANALNQLNDIGFLRTIGLRPTVKKTSADPATLAAAKRYFSVDSQSFGPRTEAYTKDKIEDNETFVTDSLRGRAGKYWTIDQQNNNFTFVDSSDPSVKSTSPYTFKTQEVYNSLEPSDFGRVEQWVTVKGNRKMFQTANKEYSKDLWNQYIRGGLFVGSTKKGNGQPIQFSSTIKENELYFDHAYEMPVPFSSDEIKDFQVPQGALVAETKPEYNFFIKDYEETITKRKDVLDNTLPNLYVFMSELKNENPNPEFRNLITLDDTLETNEQIVRRKEGRQKFDIKDHPIGQYYDLFARQYSTAVKNGAVERLSKRFSNIAVPIEEIDLFNSFNQKSEMFPMLVDIRLGTDRTTTFAQILEDSQMTNAFMTRIINRHIDGEATVMNAEVAIETIVQRADGDNKEKISKFESVKKRAWNLAEILEDLRKGDVNLNSDSSIFLGDYNQETRTLAGPEFKFFKSLMFSIVQGKFQALVKDKFRTLDEVLTGESAYSETVMYRISKHEFGPAGQPIQNVWLPNSNRIDVLRFLDTQVKYNKRYVYKIWAYQMVIGTKYWYTDLNTESYDHHASYKTHMEPSVMLVETPIMETTLRITDKPPIPPEVDIIPYKGIDNEMLFYMKSSVGEFDAEPVMIQPTDQAIFNTIRESQKKKTGEKITFGTDDHPTTYQIFRIEKQPTAYSDFTGNLRASVDTDFSLKSLQSATSISHIDGIEPNKKYYYIFRTIDVHGHVSNPTPVFEVEMINENGLIFPTIRTVDFKEMARTPDKPARRFIQIVPNVLQSLINEEKSGYNTAKTADEVKRKIHLGVTTDAVWGKRFKVRLTSKSTGKKIELNFGFEHKDAEKA